MAEIKIVDGAIRLPDTVENREQVKKFLRKLIDDKGLTVPGTGKPSKNFKEFPKVYFDGELTEFRNKAGTGDLSTNKFEWGNQPARVNEKLNRKLNTAALNEDSAKAWKKENITDWNNKNNPTGKKITADHPLFRRLEHRIKASDPFWKSQEALDLPFKAGDVENFSWTYEGDYKLKDFGESRYGSHFIFDHDITDGVGDITYTPRSKFNPYDNPASKRFTGQIPFEELVAEGYNVEKFDKHTKLKQKAFQELPSNLQAYAQNGQNGVNGKNGSNGASTILDRIKVPKKVQNVLSNKNVKGGLKLGRYGLAIGSVAITTLLANQAKAEAQTDPTLRNKALSFLRQTEAGLDWAGLTLTASGIGAPLAVPAEILSMGVGLTTDLGEHLTSDAHKNRGVIPGRSGAKRLVKANK